ncbi:hypothetical protein [Pseudomonas sp. OIL-1]|uniref:hypothetical protein n=1 Tax=Pseudomonas sp. OIL-1 TaxID=2706126 RepID=UPI0013A72D09|nr:hypothetical protein [Pseudomonas sp. OIL-1]QIB50309.1 hypothetical protein G3M63_04010 [Pseudomonas sp. OIL-1]
MRLSIGSARQSRPRRATHRILHACLEAPICFFTAEHAARPGFGSQSAMSARLRRAPDHRRSAGINGASWAPRIRMDEAGDGLSQKQLAVLVGEDGSTLVRLIDQLIGAGAPTVVGLDGAG